MIVKKRLIIAITLLSACLLFLFRIFMRSDIHLVLAKEVERLEKENTFLLQEIQNGKLSPFNTNVTFSRVKEQRNRRAHDKQISNVSLSYECETIHIALVAVGSSTVRSVATVVKSILFYRHNPLHFHFVSDDRSKYILQVLFKTWKLPAVSMSFYPAARAHDQVAWIPNSHYSGVFGLMKLTIPSLLPSSVQKVIVVDTDIMLLSDILSLWKYFDEVSAQGKLLGLVENQSDWYLGNLWEGHKPWPALGRGFNTGVMLLNLELMRASGWNQLWNTVATRVLMEFDSTALADQDIINALLLEQQNLHYELPCFWNAQLSEHSLTGYCFDNADQFKLVHWNSPLKQKMMNRYGLYFKNIYYLTQNQNGYMFREVLLNCRYNLAAGTGNSYVNSNDPCIDFRRANQTVYRTHLFLLDYEYESSEHDVTLVTQMSMDRLHMLESLCQQWDGPMSIAIYTTDSDIQGLVEYVSTFPRNSLRRLALHIVYKSQSQFYPVNYLRNVALNNVNTPNVFLSDIDFLPMIGAYFYLMEAIRILKEDGRLFVVPAFETYLYKFSHPSNKEELLTMLQNGTVFTFRANEWKKGHAPINYEHWRAASTPYKIKWAPDFEPYIVAPSNVTRYDERFTGFGWNKVSHIMELNAQGYEFVVLPSVFMIHMPHSPSPDISSFRKSKHYRDCVQVMKTEFKEELLKKYN